ncbi:hypothetical protein J6590_033751 [Homalodisca vitripennis]|nr:hypothetical protein J6590_033751 [Homalodisca vitripennis]
MRNSGSESVNKTGTGGEEAGSATCGQSPQLAALTAGHVTTFPAIIAYLAAATSSHRHQHLAALLARLPAPRHAAAPRRSSLYQHFPTYGISSSTGCALITNISLAKISLQESITTT